jgi:hypothetical protein
LGKLSAIGKEWKMRCFMRVLIGPVALCACLAASSGSSDAATVTATLKSLEGTSNFNLYVKNSAGTFHEQGGAGLFHWQGVASNPAGFKGNFTSFCTDIKDFVQFNKQFQYVLSDLGTAPIMNGFNEGVNTDLAGGMNANGNKAGMIAALYGQHYGAVINTTGSTRAFNASAFQLCIWEIVYEQTIPASLNTYDVTQYSSGGKGFEAIGLAAGLATTANNWLHTLDLSATAPRMSLAALTSGDTTTPANAQDQIVIVPFPTAISCGMALFGVLLIGKRISHVTAEI